MDGAHEQMIDTNGIRLHVAEAGPAGGVPVVLVHGFPELGYSWRHQVPVLAEAGYHVIVPDQRGYGGSDRPARVEDYGIDELTADLLGLLDHYGLQDAVFVGHDWGALVCWGMARLHPDRIRAMLAMSVPLFSPDKPPIEHFRRTAGEDFYVVKVQQPGVEDALGRDAHAMMRGAFAQGDQALPDWITQVEVDHYGDTFARTGFFGPVNYYRNLDADWRLMKDIPYSAMSMPIAFMTGTEDWVYTSPWGSVAGTDATGIEAMAQVLPDFRGTTYIYGAGHWNQQQEPEQTSRGLLEFLGQVGSTGR